ncbi:MAG TPA: biotin transporter BioY [Alphaproteobacteria bacterium]|nr:biotin transporter BioY [Alphaproteobacteria bacterium]
MQILSTIKSKSPVLNELMVVFGGVLLLFAASQVEIPLKPVPITLQSVAVMLIGLTYSPRRALESILIWFGLAAAGLPVLSGFGGGIAHFTGPTLGYLIGFLIAPYLMATLKEKYSLNTWVSDALLCLMGTLILYFTGVTWLTYLIGFSNAVMHGLVPFILPGIVKAGLLCTALQILRHYKRG